jgi:hypothetical protein
VKTDRPVFVVRLQAEPHVPDPVRSLRAGLKRLLRGYGLRCISIEQAQPTTDNQDSQQ